MSEGHAPKGQRFSHVYLDRGKPTADSARMRHRLASLMMRMDELNNFGSIAIDELGVNIAYVGSYEGRGYYHWRSFVEGCELRDVLDIISLAWRYLMTDSDTRTANRWLAGVKRIFVEENICYVLDEQGGVHFAVDSEFEANRAATIGVLRAPRYANALSEFEAGFAALPDNAKGAVRGSCRRCRWW